MWPAPAMVIWVGTSGWQYNHWQGRFYPEDLPKRRWAEYYRQQFPAVEINATFYHLPRLETVRKWQRETPEGFRYVLKGSRYITHIRRLQNCAEPVTTFLRRITPLRPSLLALLWQLPPNLQRDDERLGGFLELLPRTLDGARLRHAIEFRHRSWWQPPVFDLLSAHDVTLVWVSSASMPVDFTVTADFTYARFHGLEDGWRHNYTDAELRPFANALREAGCDGAAFFNNDGDSCAPYNAKRFAELLGDAAAPWPPSGE